MSRPKHQNKAPSAHRKTRVSSVSRNKQTVATANNAPGKSANRSVKVETVTRKSALVKDASRSIAVEKTKVEIKSEKDTPTSIEIKKPAPKNIADQAEEHALSSIISSLDKLAPEKSIPLDLSTTKFKPQVKIVSAASKPNSVKTEITRQVSAINVKIDDAKQAKPTNNAEKKEAAKTETRAEAKIETKTKVEVKAETRAETEIAAKTDTPSSTATLAAPAKKVFTSTGKFQPNIKSEAKPTFAQAPQSKIVKTASAQTPQSQITKQNQTAIKPAQPEVKVKKATPIAPPVTASILKQEAIEKAVQSTNSHINRSSRKERKGKLSKGSFGWQRLLLTFSCALIITFAVAYFVNLRQSDLSLQVAAMRTGIDASYPSYTPRDFSLTDITSENGKITMNFKNYDTNTAYTLTEEKSTWDSNALYNSYIKENYGDDYVTVREQGLTIYIDGQETAWVNGGIFYRIKISSGTLTKKQITTIATSL